MHSMYQPRPLGAPHQRFAQPYPGLQPAPQTSQRPIAPAPPAYPLDEPITPLDQSPPPHLRAHYAERAQNPASFAHPHINVQVPLDPRVLEPMPPACSLSGGDEYPQFQQSMHERHQMAPTPATAPSFALQPGSRRPSHSAPDSTSLFGPSPYQQLPVPQQYDTAIPAPQPIYSPIHAPTPTALSPSSTSSNNCPLSIPLGAEYVVVSGSSREHRQDYNDYSQRSDLRRFTHSPY